MSYLTLDLSSKCSGWAKFSNDGKLVDKGKFSPDKNIANFFKIHYLVEQIKTLFDDVETLIIEDLFFGKNFKSIKYLARLSGAVINSWVNLKYSEPILYNASHARAQVEGLKGNFHKAQIQIFVIEKYKFATKPQIKKYKERLEELKEQYDKKELKRGQYKYRLDKLSVLIDEETNIGEDLSDAIVLGLAYKNKEEKC